jgi:Uma2 family endonuclease
MPFPPDMKFELADLMTYQRDEQGNPIPPPPRRMTEQEFLAWTATEEVRSEWSDGVAYELVSPHRRHQELLGFLAGLLYIYVESKGLGCVIPGFEMRLRGGRSYRLPDILFVTAANKHLLNDRRLDGPADLVVEIVGGDTAEQDLRDKFQEYAASGVAEYWIMDPRPRYQGCSAFHLDENGIYRPIVIDADGRVQSREIRGFWFDPRWLKMDSYPNPVALLTMIAPGSLQQAL